MELKLTDDGIFIAVLLLCGAVSIVAFGLKSLLALGMTILATILLGRIQKAARKKRYAAEDTERELRFLKEKADKWDAYTHTTGAPHGEYSR